MILCKCQSKLVDFAARQISSAQYMVADQITGQIKPI